MVELRQRAVQEWDGLVGEGGGRQEEEEEEEEEEDSEGPAVQEHRREREVSAERGEACERC